MSNRREYSKQYYLDNKERITKYKKQYHINNRKRLIDKSIEWAKNNPEKRKEQCKQWYLKNKDKVSKQTSIWRENNPEKVKEMHRKYRINNKIKINILKRKWMNFKRKTDLKYSLDHRISESIRQSIKENKANRHWETLVGYTLSDLIKHLQKAMPQNYTWDDFLQGKLHIDHKVPISAHNFNKIGQIDFQRCWALSNLQLLPARENISKSNKLYKPFQPALQI